MGNGLDHAFIVHFEKRIVMCDWIVCCMCCEIVCLVNSIGKTLNTRVEKM